MKRIDVFNYDEWRDSHSGRPPEKASDFQVWINNMLNGIPREFFDSATVEISGSAAYNSGYLEMQISYYRPETAEEIAEEEAEKQAKLNRAQRDKLDTFLRLKQESEGKKKGGGVQNERHSSNYRVDRGRL